MKKFRKLYNEAAKCAPISVKRMKDSKLKLFVLLICFPFILAKNRWLLHDKALHLDYFEVVVTTRCTLRCQNCANLMQYYHQPMHVDWDVIEKSVKRLLECIDRVERVGVLGGEPLLYPELDKIIYLLESSPKVKTIRVVTNGTLIPKDEKILKALTSRKVTVQLNNYLNAYAGVADELAKLFDERKIKYRLLKKDGTEWVDYGDLSCRNRSKEELVKQFKKCKIDCRSLYNGKLFYCPRSGHGMDLKLLSEVDKDYVDLIDTAMSVEETRKKLYELLYEKQYIEACNHCDKGTELCKPIPAAIQMERTKNNM